MALAPSLLEPSSEIAEVDLVEVYFERGWTDGLPVVPPSRLRSMPSWRPLAAIQTSSSAKSLRAGEH